MHKVVLSHLHYGSPQQQFTLWPLHLNVVYSSENLYNAAIRYFGGI